jgi:hypothetical protein
MSSNVRSWRCCGVRRRHEVRRHGALLPEEQRLAVQRLEEQGRWREEPQREVRARWREVPLHAVRQRRLSSRCRREPRPIARSREQ